MTSEISADKKHLYMRLEELMKEKNISKTRLCRDLNMQMTNLNKYYRNRFKRVDAALIVKLCDYFHCGISDLLEIRVKPEYDDILPVITKETVPKQHSSKGDYL